MTEPGGPETLHAVVDRIVGDRAVLLVGDDEAEMVVGIDWLGEHGEEGAHLLVRRDGARFIVEGRDTAAEAVRRAELGDRLAHLRRRRPSSTLRPRRDRDDPDGSDDDGPV